MSAFKDACKNPCYALIASRIHDEPTLAYALDLFDVIERLRIVRNASVSENRTSDATRAEDLRSVHIDTLSRLMSSHQNVSLHRDGVAKHVHWDDC